MNWPEACIVITVIVFVGLLGLAAIANRRKP